MLTKEQEAAVNHVYGPMMVVAGPGSGKTMVLTRRIQKLLEYTAPERIMVITFARKAAEEMKQRFAAFTDGETAEKVWFGTFHSIFFRLLRRWNIVDEQTTILDEEGEEKLRKTLSRDSEGSPAFFMCQRDVYEAEKKKRNLMDFEDIINQMAEEIKHHTLWRQFDFFLIDEFQDINMAQYEIVCQMVGERNPNLFVVGDEDQAIYAFRGSKPELFLAFPKDFPNCPRLDLRYNFRCQAQVVAAAAELISHNQQRFEKTLQAVKKAEKKIAVRPVFDEEMEARLIRRAIFWRHRRGLPYDHMAVLCRTRAQLRNIKAALQEGGIPFICPYDFAYTDHHDALLVEEDLKRISELAQEPGNLDAFKSVMKLFPFLQESGDFRRLAKREDILKGLSEQNKLSASQRREVIELKRRLNKGKKFSQQGQYLQWLLQTDYLTYAYSKIKERELSRFTVWKQIWRYYRPNKKGVNLLTMHGAKGLEFEWVWIAGLEDGECPRREAADSREKLEEERRLLYVAITRAKRELTLSFYDGFSRKKSRFLKEMEQSLSNV